jgi:hypothetical protein
MSELIKSSIRKDMEAYSRLIKKAAGNISKLLGKRNEAQLEGRGGKLINESEIPKGDEDFELVTWLIIK